MKDTLVTAAGGIGVINVSSIIDTDSVQMITQIAIAVVTIVKLIRDMYKKKKKKNG